MIRLNTQQELSDFLASLLSSQTPKHTFLREMLEWFEEFCFFNNIKYTRKDNSSFKMKFLGTEKSKKYLLKIYHKYEDPSLRMAKYDFDGNHVIKTFNRLNSKNLTKEILDFILE